MDLRELKGLEIAARTKIVFADGVWLVPSQTTTTKYKVVLDGRESCECDDFTLRQLPCKHIHAARLARERDHGGASPVVVAEPVPKKPTYRQVWPAYNEAKTTEKRRLQALLADLCRHVPQFPDPERGQKRIPTADVVFAMVFKVYTCMPTRRFACDLEDAREKGHVSQVAHFNSIIRHFDNPDLTPILRDLVTRASLPLKAVEVDFAADSSGFSTNRFVKWYDEKYGVTRSGHDWVKCHVMVGVKTNIVTAVEIRGRDANDSPLLPPLVRTTAENFPIREVSADKGYSSAENMEEVVRVGGTPFIAYKTNATGAAGGMFERVFHYFLYRREEFLAHYHKRSNVESAFSMIKAKFRDHVRAKTDAAMVNEALCKFLCHNIRCVIQAQCELGIEAEFWKDEKAEAGSADVLPMVRPG